LVELGAVLTKRVCEEFPEITGKILEDIGTISVLEDEDSIVEGDNLSQEKQVFF